MNEDDEIGDDGLTARERAEFERTMEEVGYIALRLYRLMRIEEPERWRNEDFDRRIDQLRDYRHRVLSHLFEEGNKDWIVARVQTADELIEELERMKAEYR
jgi:hypothetical protein